MKTKCPRLCSFSYGKGDNWQFQGMQRWSLSQSYLILGLMQITRTSAGWALLHAPLEPSLPTRELWHYWGPGIIAHTGPLLWALLTLLFP